MSVALTLRDVSPEELMADVYFLPEFVELHSGEHSVDSLITDDFRHTATVRPIPGTDLEDLETPWGYGGPAARSLDAMRENLSTWRTRQKNAGRVAEFVRLHPFLNPVALERLFDALIFDRPTVLVDLSQSAEDRWKFYSKGTKHGVKSATKNLVVRQLDADEWEIFRDIYLETMSRNQALELYHLPDDYYQKLLATEWNTAFVVEKSGTPIAVASFLCATPGLVHYHLSGVTQAGRAANANYLLLENAFRHFSERGAKWMHLGGGRTRRNDDELLRFKEKFSPLKAHFYVGGMVFDDDAYRRLGGRSGRLILGYRYKANAPTSDAEITLRPAVLEDFPSFFRLKCDPVNIYWSGHQAPPDWVGLKSWFRAQLEGRDTHIYLAEREGEILGYAYVKTTPDGTAESSVGVDSIFAGNGIGREILRQTVDIVACERSGNAPIEAWIFPDNEASVKAHEAAGYRRVPEGPHRPISMPLPGQPSEQHLWIWRPENTSA